MRNPADQAGIRRPSAPKTTPCCSKVGIKRGPWTAEEDEILASYIKKEGEGAWRTLPKRAGLLRCGKSCRLRWMNYLRPHLNRGPITPDEEDLILRLHRLLGNRWSLIAGRIPGRTDNEIKNFWNTHLSKKLISQGLDPRNHKPLVVYNPNPNHNNNNDNNNQNYARPRPQVENSTMEAIPNPNPIVSAPPTSTTSMPNSSPVVLNQEDEMYFSSFLDSLIMNEESVFDQQAVTHNQHMLQDQSMMMMMMMQPTMGFESNHSQGFVWGSNREVSGFSNYPRDEGNRNLDPGILKRIWSYKSMVAMMRECMYT